MPSGGHTEFTTTVGIKDNPPTASPQIILGGDRPGTSNMFLGYDVTKIYPCPDLTFHMETKRLTGNHDSFITK